LIEIEPRVEAVMMAGQVQYTSNLRSLPVSRRIPQSQGRRPTSVGNVASRDRTHPL